MQISLHKGIRTTTPTPGVDIMSYRMTSDGAVTVLLSFLAGDTFAPRKLATIADITASLLDAGTKKHAKDALREKIEALGASIHFFARGNRVSGVVRGLHKDMAILMPLVVEQLTAATFQAKEIAIVKSQMRAQCEEDKSETGGRALQKLSELLYPKSHPNYIPSIEERLRSIAAVERSDILEFYRTYYGRSSMHVVAVGDIAEENVHRIIANSVRTLPLRRITPPARPAVPQSTATHEIISIKDKMTVDVVMGHEVPFTRDHEDYYPFMLGIEILGGGGFTSHLMQTVRERDGLTYHIRAGLSGFGEHDQGNWFIRSQFAPTLFTRGVETTLKEIRHFMTSTMTNERIEAKKSEIIGSYLVSLGTTQGIASRVLRICDEGKPLEEIDTYPDTIAGIQPEQVRAVMKKYLDMSRISIVSAGSIDKKGKPL